MDRRTRAGLLLAFLGVAAFSLTLPMSRVALEGLSAPQIAVWRAIVAAAAAAAILAALRPPPPRGRQWYRLLMCAGGVVFGFPVFTTLAMETVTAAHGAVVVGLLALGTAIVGAAIGGERPSPAFWAVAALGTGLTVLFVLRQSSAAGTADAGLAVGHLHLALAVATASIGYAHGGLLARSLPGWSVACWSLVVSLPVLVLAAAFVPPPSPAAEGRVLGAFAYLALVSQLGGFFFWYRGLAMAGIARASQVQLLQLFMTLAAAFLLFGEPFDPEAVVFGALVVATVAIGTRLRAR